MGKDDNDDLVTYSLFHMYTCIVIYLFMKLYHATTDMC